MNNYIVKGNPVKTLTLDEAIAKLKQYEIKTRCSETPSAHADSFRVALNFLVFLYDTTEAKVLEKLKQLDKPKE